MSPNRRTVLAVDAGKSSTRAALFHDGQRSPTLIGPGIENIISPGGLQQIRDALAETLQGLPETSGDVTVCLGMTGVLHPAGYAATIAEALSDTISAQRLLVTSDVVTTYCGALGEGPGVVVAAGTGAITLALSSEGEATRVDGWGYLLDDAGSGFMIGREGLQAALRAADGRGGSEALRSEAEAAFGCTEAITSAVYGSPNPVRAVAAFAQCVAAAARAGDRVAAEIWRRAARQLAASVAAASTRALPNAPSVAISWNGGIFQAGDLVVPPFLEAVHEMVPEAAPRPPAGDALDGAAAIAFANDDSPVRALVEAWDAAP